MKWCKCWHVFCDENNACFIAIEVGWTDLIATHVSIDNDISSSNFDCSDTRIILIAKYVSTFSSVHPASIAVKHALFSSIDTCVAIKLVHPASIAVILALFSSIDTCVAITSVHPTSIAIMLALFSSQNTCQHFHQFIQLRLQWYSHYSHRKIRVNI